MQNPFANPIKWTGDKSLFLGGETLVAIIVELRAPNCENAPNRRLFPLVDCARLGCSHRMSAEYLAELKRAVEVSHGCTAKHSGTVPVREFFRGSVIWDGEVEVFDLTGHPKAARCYAWGYPEDGGKLGQIEAVTVLELPPVTSPLTAVRAAIASKAHKL